MEIIVKVHGVEVVCSTPEAAAAVAAVSTKIEVPSKDKIADRIKGPFKVNINGIEVTCDTAEAAAYTAAAASGAPIKRKGMSEEAKGKQGEGPRRAWQEAEDYAKKHGITTDEARRILAKKKKELMAKALLAATAESPRKRK